MLKPSIAGLLIAAVGLASAARAQIISTPGITATLDLTWQEDPAYPHNDNGVLEPGEHALILMTPWFTGQFTPVTASGLNGILRGFAECYVDIRSLAGDAGGLYNGGITAPISTSAGPNADNAGTSGYGVRGGWRLGGNVANGQPAAGGMVNIGAGQLPIEPSACNTTNPIANMERLGWQPASYAQRTQTFTVAGAVGTNNNVVGLYLDLDGSAGHPGTTGITGYLRNFAITFGSVDIPIVPGPAGLPLLGMGVLAVACRRRRSGPLAEASR